jgi:hypothetical protein
MKTPKNESIINRYNELLKTGLSKSKIFVQLYNEGFDVADIARSTENHYSFVYGRIQESVGGNASDVRKFRTDNKADKIREFYKNGYTPAQIARKLSENGDYTNYSYVMTVIKKIRDSENAI